MSGFGAFSHFLLLLIFPSLLISAASYNVAENGSEMQPLIGPGQKSMVVDETRRQLGSFRICALCTCCGGPKGICVPSPCCYAINCNIPNRPFGFCAFTPKTCNCFGCHL